MSFRIYKEWEEGGYIALKIDYGWDTTIYICKNCERRMGTCSRAVLVLDNKEKLLFCTFDCLEEFIKSSRGIAYLL